MLKAISDRCPLDETNPYIGICPEYLQGVFLPSGCLRSFESRPYERPERCAIALLPSGHMKICVCLSLSSRRQPKGLSFRRSRRVSREADSVSGPKVLHGLAKRLAQSMTSSIPAHVK